MDLGMAVRERKTACAIMVAGRHIDIISRAGRVTWLITITLCREGAIVDAIRMLVDEDKRFGGKNHVGQFAVFAPIRA